jgi:hypothetical protein
MRTVFSFSEVGEVVGDALRRAMHLSGRWLHGGLVTREIRRIAPDAEAIRLTAVGHVFSHGLDASEQAAAIERDTRPRQFALSFLEESDGGRESVERNRWRASRGRPDRVAENGSISTTDTTEALLFMAFCSVSGEGGRAAKARARRGAKVGWFRGLSKLGFHSGSARVRCRRTRPRRG